jgi:hypothetical protein
LPQWCTPLDFIPSSPAANVAPAQARNHPDLAPKYENRAMTIWLWELFSFGSPPAKDLKCVKSQDDAAPIAPAVRIPVCLQPLTDYPLSPASARAVNPHNPFGSGDCADRADCDLLRSVQEAVTRHNPTFAD